MWREALRLLIHKFSNGKSSFLFFFPIRRINMFSRKEEKPGGQWKRASANCRFMKIIFHKLLYVHYLPYLALTLVKKGLFFALRVYLRMMNMRRKKQRKLTMRKRKGTKEE